MTKREIAECLGYCIELVSKAFDLAAKNNKDMAEKSKHYSKMKPVNWTLEETLEAMPYLPSWTPMMKQYLIEHFIDRPGMFHNKWQDRKIKLPAAAKDFMFLWKSHGLKNKLKVCNCCTYCVPNQINKPGQKPKPYCNFYGVFLNKVHVNVYRDSCPTFEPAGEDVLPIIWEYPSNMNIYGEVSTKTLGIDNSEFKSTREKGEPIVLLSECRTVQ